MSVARLFDQAARQRRDLEDQGARLGAKAFEAGHDELAGGNGGIEEVGIGHLPSPSSSRITASQTSAGAFTTKLK